MYFILGSQLLICGKISMFKQVFLLAVICSFFLLPAVDAKQSKIRSLNINQGEIDFRTTDENLYFIGFPATKRIIRPGDVVQISTRQAIKKGDVIQRNALYLIVQPKGLKLPQEQCTSLGQCLGKIANRDLHKDLNLKESDFEKSSIKTSKVVKAKGDINIGQFVYPAFVEIVEMPVAPNKTPMNWLSSLDEVVGRKATKSIKAGQLITEDFFGQKGISSEPEKIIRFDNGGNPLNPQI